MSALQRRLPADIASVRSARLHVQDVADVDASHPAALCVSELATNAVLHAGTEFSVAVDCIDGMIRVEVVDGADTRPAVPTHTSLVADGRGLQIVASLATRWGVDVLPRGKRVWFELPVTTG